MSVVKPHSPIYSLPSELISKILLLTLPADLTYIAKLCTVCTYFKDVIQGNPSFWTTIIINESITQLPLYPTPYISPWTVSSAIETAVCCSNGHPLRVVFDPKGMHITQSNVGFFMPICISLLQAIDQIYDFSISGECWELQEFVMRFFTNRTMPRLENFDHHWSTNELFGVTLEQHEVRSSSYRNMFNFPIAVSDPEGNAHRRSWAGLLYPALKKVTLVSAPCDWPQLSMAGLTELRIGRYPLNVRPTHSELREMLSLSRDTLRVLELQECLDDRPDTFSQAIPPLEFSVLETLGLGYTFPNELVPFFAHTSFPALKHLTLRDVHGRRPMDADMPAPVIQMPPLPTTEMFKAMRRLPLEQLETVTLDKVRFFGSQQDLEFIPYSIEMGLVKEKDMPIFLAFVRSLRSVKELRLGGASLDKWLYSAIHCPVTHFVDGMPVVMKIDGMYPVRNLPSLRSVTLDARTSVAEWRCAQEFVDARQQTWALGGRHRSGLDLDLVKILIPDDIGVPPSCMEDLIRFWERLGMGEVRFQSGEDGALEPPSVLGHWLFNPPPRLHPEGNEDDHDDMDVDE